MQNWYVVRSKPNKEEFLRDQLLLRQVEVYYPQISVRPANPRAKKIKSYFPGYLFVRLQLDSTVLSTLQWIPGSIGLVSFDGVPSMVPDPLIAAIRRHVEEVNNASVNYVPGLQRGDRVEIDHGPFAGYEAVFDAHLSGSERVRVLLKLLNDRRQMAIELPADQIHIKARK